MSNVSTTVHKAFMDALPTRWESADRAEAWEAFAHAVDVHDTEVEASRPEQTHSCTWRIQAAKRESAPNPLFKSILIEKTTVLQRCSGCGALAQKGLDGIWSDEDLGLVADDHPA